jgi:formylglycine-generating enzyme required for sulfatase activity/tRNA A-37 threonylcarbamoyl transferase component Bud32/predicted esterase
VTHPPDALPVPAALRDALADRYDVERRLGAGGMATVYLARDRKHDRHVAIKVLHHELASAVGAERFLREIAIASRLQHPHVLTLIDSGEATDAASGDRILYYVMPYVQGESLRDRLTRTGALPTDECIRLLRDVVDAMVEAHAAGIVHRDLKPDNVMIAGAHALVVDFGVAKAMSDARGSTALTATGISLGSPAYMAPEQALGEPNVDHRADIYALGALAYEMLTGRAPFTGSLQSVLAAHINRAPRPPRELNTDLPAAVERIVLKCLEKDPAARYQSARELLTEIDVASALTSTIALAPPAHRLRVLLASTAVLIVVIGAVSVLLTRSRRERWVNETAIPSIVRLAEAGDNDSAFALATHAAAVSPKSPVLQSLWPRFAQRLAFTTVPAGARVERARFTDTTHWDLVGTTPTGPVLVPAGVDRYRITKDGYRPVFLLAGGIPTITSPPPPDTVRLDSVNAPHPEMVRVPADVFAGELLQLRALPSRRIGDYLVDRLETTNAEFKRFVDAGGYTRRELWVEPFVKDGRTLTWEQAMSLFIDRTGRPGPATWEGGSFPPQAGDLPVGGLSWYEAGAYATFAGKSLPTLYHWVRAAGTSASAYVIPGSRFDADGPVRGGSFGSMGPWGTFDTAGNMREWCINLDGAGKRYLLGGGWNDSPFRFSDATALPPFDRSASNGVRLVKYLEPEPESARTSDPIVGAFRDYYKERRPTEAELAAYRRFYDYDRTPLNARVDFIDSTQTDWIVERVSLDAAYGGERLLLNIFRPRRTTAPLQVVVGFPGSDAMFATKTDDRYSNLFGFVVRNGRALVLPVYKSTYERNDGLRTNQPDPSIAYRDHVVMWAKDARRTVDYVSSRADLDSTRIGFFGVSWGGRIGPLIMAVEPRFRAGVLFLGGLAMGASRPEVDPFNFLPAVTSPVLMLNGNNDQVFPVETAQKPMFQLLGTPADRKRYQVYEGGHFVPRTAMIAETLQWFDRYLGPVGNTR